MTVVHKVKRKGPSCAMVDSLRAKASGLVYYAYRADLRALASVSMKTALDAYHADLLRYIRRDAHKEEVAATLTRNLRSNAPALIAAEMGALIEDAEPTTDIVEHYIMSLRESEKFGEHLDDTVDTFLKGLGLQNCPAVAALHRDTDNEHIHIVVLRIDTLSGEIVDPLKYDIIRAHQMLAIIEEKTGWSREEQARWEVSDGRLLLDGKTDIGPADDPSVWPDRYYPPVDVSSQARKQEEKTGYESAERIVRQVVPDLIRMHPDLPSFLDALREEGIALSKKGSGAVYRVRSEDEDGNKREELVRCSVIRRWSYAKLHARYGDLPNEFGGEGPTRVSTPKDGDQDKPRYAALRERYREQVNAITRDVRMAVPRGAGIDAAIVAGRGACVFPGYNAWKSGEMPPDPNETMFTHVGVRIFDTPSSQKRSRLKGQTDAHFVAARSGRRTIYQPRSAPIEAGQVIEFGERIILTGAAGDVEVNKVMTLFALRGATTVRAWGLNRKELNAAKRIAAVHGIEVIKAEGDQKAGLPTQSTVKDQKDISGAAKDAHFRQRASGPTSFPMRKEEQTNVHTDSDIRHVAAGSKAFPEGSVAAQDYPELISWRKAELACNAARQAPAEDLDKSRLERERDRQASLLLTRLAQDCNRGLLSDGEVERLKEQANKHAQRIAAMRAGQLGLGR